MAGKTRDKEATRRALLDAGRKAFAEHGFEGARNHAIADAAGTNKAMINYIFGGKQGLFSAILLHDIGAVRQALEPVATSRSEPVERFAELVDAMAAAMARNPHFPLIMVREQMSGARRVDAEVREAFFGFFRLTRSILEQGVRRGELRPADPHAVHLCMVGSLVYFLMTEPARRTYAAAGTLRSPPPRWDDHVAEIRGLLRRGLASHKNTTNKRRKA